MSNLKTTLYTESSTFLVRSAMSTLPVPLPSTLWKPACGARFWLYCWCAIWSVHHLSCLQSHALKTAVVLEQCNLTKPGIKQERSRKKKLSETRGPEIPESIGFIPSLTFLKNRLWGFFYSRNNGVIIMMSKPIIFLLIFPSRYFCTLQRIKNKSLNNGWTVL